MDVAIRFHVPHDDLALRDELKTQQLEDDWYTAGYDTLLYEVLDLCKILDLRRHF